ncbi:MAG: undecaprenyldiphospho-muramoylpentapeptide beta-N-acetylglucosaminyltransferase [Candidatus Niyogibacteria bacterium]|nr:undecaprenyldiphospho-muramoylpentapeptide beta-N-acetylglucosaminyltransferase [Candidatus Niyogibacteria bacterium]
MKILFAGGGTGGHFYPIIAVARSLRDLAEKERIARLDLSYMSDAPYDINLLRQENIKFLQAPAGKMRRYFSIWNFVDYFRTFFGIIRAVWGIFWDMPDVVFGKGGYASFPMLVAARLFRIPLLIHESDAVPGRANAWAGKFAKRIAIAFPEAAEYFPKDKTALIGNPIRRRVVGGSAEEAIRSFGLDGTVKTIFVIGGSQGSQNINDAILTVLLDLVEKYNVIHQTGKQNYEVVNGRAGVILNKLPNATRYHAVDFVSEGDLRNISQVASLVISRAGSGAIFEIAAWGLPAILIPLDNSAGDHQRKNAYSYVKAGAAAILEEQNLTPHVLNFEIDKVLKDEKRLQDMRTAAQRFARLDAADKIARALIDMAIEHAD